MPKRKKGRQRYRPAEDTGQYRPVRAVIAARDVNDKYSSYPSDGLTPVRLARIFKEADDGDVLRQMELFGEMEEKDPHLFSQLQTRKLAVTGLDWEIQPADEEELSEQAADFVREQLQGLENFDEVLTDLLDAIGKGISIMELEWGTDADGADIIENIEYVHPKKLIWNSQTDEMQICTKEFPGGVSLPENKFAVHRYKAKSGHASRNGILRVVAWMYLFKNYDVKDWVAFCEVFGMPLRLGKYNAAASDDDKRELERAIYSLGTDAAGIVPDTTVIEFIESQKTTSVEIYERLARYCDEQISKAVLGQTLSSDSGGGSYAQGKVHNEVRHDLTAADAKALAVTIRRDIIRPLVEFNFGPGVGIPMIQFDCKEAEDQKELVDVYRTLACDMGLKIPTAHIYKKFGIPKPDDGEEVLNPRSSAGTAVAEFKDLPGTGSGEELRRLDLKEETAEVQETQKQLDQMAEEAVRKSEAAFREMFKPVLKIADTAKDLETLREALKDGVRIRELYEEMESPELNDLLHQALYLSELAGRSMT